MLKEKEEGLRFIWEKIKNENDGNHIDFAIPGYLQKKMETLHAMLEDVSICKNAALTLLEKKYDDPLIKKCCFYSMIVLYGKCFTDASNAKRTKLEARDVISDLNPTLITTHQKIMKIRHNYVAHNGDDENDYGFVYLKLNIRTLMREVKSKKIRRSSLDKQDLRYFVELCQNVLDKIETMAHKYAERVWKNMLKDYDLSMLKIAGPRIPYKKEN